MSRLLVPTFALFVACELNPQMLGPRPDAELCFGTDSATCEYAWDPVDVRLACTDDSGTATLNYVLVNAGELELEYSLVPDATANPGFETIGPSSGTVAPFDERPFSVRCDSACMERFRESSLTETSWEVRSNDPRRPVFNFIVSRKAACAR